MLRRYGLRVWLAQIASALVLMMVGYVGYNTFMPSSMWIEYRSIAAIPPARAGEPIRILSTYTIRQSANYDWRYELVCDRGDGFEPYSGMLTGGFRTPRQWGAEVWVYTGAIPEEKATCFIRGQIEINIASMARRFAPVPPSELFEISIK